MNNQKNMIKWESKGYYANPELPYMLTPEDAMSERIINILEFILKNGPTYQQELSDELNISFTTLTYPLNKLYNQAIIRRAPGEDDKGRLIRCIGLAIDEDDLKKYLSIVKKARKDLENGLSMLKKGIKSYYNKLPEPLGPFKLRRAPIIKQKHLNIKKDNK